MTAPPTSRNARARRAFVAGLIGLAGALLATIAFIVTYRASPWPWVASGVAIVMLTGANMVRIAATRIFTTSHYIGTMLLVGAALIAEAGIWLYPYIFALGLFFFSAFGFSGNTVEEREADRPAS